MKNQELFDKTVNILVNAYRNNTLQHGICTACAVGNIVAANCGIADLNSMEEWREKAIHEPCTLGGWPTVFTTDYKSGHQRTNNLKYVLVRSAKFQIDSTGYTWQELAKIEYAFEIAPKGENDDDWMLNGLLAVYDVLCEIHQVNKEEVKEGNLIFVK